MSLSSTLRLTREPSRPKNSQLPKCLLGWMRTIKSLRNFANEFKTLYTLGLISSIEWLVQEFERIAAIEFDLFINVETYPNPKTPDGLFRIIFKSRSCNEY